MLFRSNTSINYKFNSELTTGSKTGQLPITPLTDYPMNDGYGRRMLTTTANTTLVVTATMATSNPDIAPFIDTSRMGMIAIENIINDLPLSNSGFVISNAGSSYANSSDVTVTITGGGGSLATATATVAANIITGITLTSAGSGYETSPTITITPGSGGGSGAVVTYNGEDKKTGGKIGRAHV